MFNPLSGEHLFGAGEGNLLKREPAQTNQTHRTQPPFTGTVLHNGHPRPAVALGIKGLLELFSVETANEGAVSGHVIASGTKVAAPVQQELRKTFGTHSVCQAIGD